MRKLALIAGRLTTREANYKQQKTHQEKLQRLQVEDMMMSKKTKKEIKKIIEQAG